MRRGHLAASSWRQTTRVSSACVFSTAAPAGAGEEGERKSHLIYRSTLVATNTANAGAAAGDLLVTPTSFALRLRDELDGWLLIDANELQVELDLSWSLAPEAIWASGWSPRLAVRLFWKEIIGSSFSPPPTPALSGRVYRAGTLADAADAAVALYEALPWSEGSQPQSLLPVLVPAPGQQTVRFMLLSAPLDAAVEKAGQVVLGRGESTRARGMMRLTLAPPGRLLPGEGPGAFNGFAAFPSFFQSTAPAPSAKLPLTLSPESLEDEPDSEAIAVFASFRLAWDGTIAPTHTLSWRGRLSSLTLSGPAVAWSSAVTALGGQEGTLRIGGPGTRTASRALGARVVDGSTVAVSATFTLPLGRVVPVGADVARGDRSGHSAGLLIPLADKKDPPGGVPFFLSVTERMASTEDRLLTATVFDNSDESGSQDYVLLGSEPFSVMRFAEVRLGARGDASNAAVATYSSDTRIWQLKQVTPYYHYVLPSQVAGEGSDKPHRLELFDLATPQTPNEGPFRPYDDEPLATNADPERWGDLHRRAVSFKLTPSAEIWLKPSDVERRYFMPAWDTYDLFRQRGALGLGAAVAAFRAEFLYGLSVGVDVTRETGAGAQARLAEIEALIGRPVGPAQAVRTGDEDLGARWNALAAVIMRRPERLEVWASDPSSTLEFAPARFADGVSFALRGSALSRTPILETGVVESDGLPQVPSGERLRQHPQGLAGGAFWPIESPNLFQSLQKNPDAVGGSLQGVAFSALGGDAQQKAEFLNGKVAILSETRNGFVERQKVEVLGRIGALWHRAKHVIVYQRTTNPTAQFAPKQKEDPQRRRSRRPILRKVSEYIELIDCERSYPDFSEGNPRSAGYLKKVRFNSKIINVDSAWARDIGTDAFEIPLWDRLSARERPQVYPLPDIAFVTVAEGDGDDALVAQECLDPQNLFFFADVSSATSSDTNTWLARIGIDFGNVPPASTLAAVVDEMSSADPAENGRRRNVSRQLPGTGRFSWRLAPASRKTAINAGRSPKPVYVALDTISFMRGTQTAAPFPGELTDIVKARGQAMTSPPIDGLFYWPPAQSQDEATAARMPQTAVAFTAAVAAFKATLPQVGPINLPALQRARTNIDRTLNDLKAPLRDSLRAPLQNAAAVAETFAKAQTFISSGQRACETLKANALGLIKGKSALVLENIRAWEAKAEAVQYALPLAKKDLRTDLLGEVDRLLRPIFDEASADVGRGTGAVEAARAIVADTQAEAEAVIARTRARVKTCIDAYDRNMPSSPARRAAFQTSLVAAVSSVNDDLEAAVDEARQRLGVELGNASQAIAGHLAIALEEIAKTQIFVLADLKNGRWWWPIAEARRGSPGNVARQRWPRYGQKGARRGA